MPSKKKKYNARFPPARIKKIMQTDEEVGKVAQAVPVIISRALELFVESLLKKSVEITSARNAKTLSPSHLKLCILSERRFDFLKDLVKSVPDVVGDSDENLPLETDHLPFETDPLYVSGSNPQVCPLPTTSQMDPGVPCFTGEVKAQPGVPCFAGEIKAEPGVPCFAGEVKAQPGVPGFAGEVKAHPGVPCFAGEVKAQPGVPCFAGEVNAESGIPYPCFASNMTLDPGVPYPRFGSSDVPFPQPAPLPLSSDSDTLSQIRTDNPPHGISLQPPPSSHPHFYTEAS